MLYDAVLWSTHVGFGWTNMFEYDLVRNYKGLFWSVKIVQKYKKKVSYLRTPLLSRHCVGWMNGVMLMWTNTLSMIWWEIIKESPWSVEITWQYKNRGCLHLRTSLICGWVGKCIMLVWSNMLSAIWWEMIEGQCWSVEIMWQYKIIEVAYILDLLHFARVIGLGGRAGCVVIYTRCDVVR